MYRQAGEEGDAATLQCHLHAHPLAVNSSDKDRLCSHTGLVDHYTDMELAE